MSIIISTPEAVYTPVCGIHRWPEKLLFIKHGVYHLVASLDVWGLIVMDRNSKFTHPVAVVDDFGNLVGVPA